MAWTGIKRSRASQTPPAEPDPADLPGGLDYEPPWIGWHRVQRRRRARQRVAAAQALVRRLRRRLRAARRRRRWGSVRSSRRTTSRGDPDPPDPARAGGPPAPQARRPEPPNRPPLSEVYLECHAPVGAWALPAPLGHGQVGADQLPGLGHQLDHHEDPLDLDLGVHDHLDHVAEVGEPVAVAVHDHLDVDQRPRGAT